MSIFTPKTIRAKMILVVFSITAVLAAAIITIGHGVYERYKSLRVSECRLQVVIETSKLNTIVHHLADSALELALSGELLFHSDAALSGEPGRFALSRALTDDQHASGGGIWFRPYLLGPNEQRVGYYAYSKEGSIIFDPSVSGAEYDYPSRQWYTEITDKLKKNPDSREEVWSAPYVDVTGAKTLMTTVAYGMYAGTGDFDATFIGLGTVDWRLDDIVAEVAEIRPTPGSFALFADTVHDYILALSDPSLNESQVGKSLSTVSWYSPDIPAEREIIHNGKRYLSYTTMLGNDMVIAVNVPVEELFSNINAAMLQTLFALGITALLIVSLTWVFLVHFITRPVNVLARAAAQIGAGNLDCNILLKNRDEFGALAALFNKMTQDLKLHIAHVNAVTAEKEHYATELAIAREIQTSMLPCVFPPFPERGEVDLRAFMLPAKEVGGDFYDFFFIEENKLAVVIADVSDKGVPAALFMVITKTLIRDNALPGVNAEEILRRVNARLNENNATGMFVTAALGILDLENGEFTYANAGHNPLYIMRGREGFALLPMPKGLMLGIMPDIAYASQNVRLEPGDALFLYTDGVTEAENNAHEFYTDKRLLENLNAHVGLVARNGIAAFLDSVKQDLDSFSAGAEPHDDTTMLALVYYGSGKNIVSPPPVSPAGHGEAAATGTRPAIIEEERSFPARVDALHDVLAFVETELDEAGCPESNRMRVALAVEEMFVNIASYAYEGSGLVIVRLNVKAALKHAVIVLADTGRPFNPLEREEPDISLPPEDRGVGGMGIFLAKKNTSSLEYRRENDRNELIMTFSWA